MRPSASSLTLSSSLPTSSPFTSKSRSSRMLKEWSIPSKDVKFSEVLTSGRFGDVCRGRWHGEVLIYTFSCCKEEEELDLLWQQVAILSCLRHENLQLFMGAVLEPVPCIITSMRKGPTLYEKVHQRNEFLSRTYKISIARQVSNALSYLQAKSSASAFASLTGLTSHHIILENKVKLCLIERLIASHSCPCVPCASTLGLIACFVRSPFNSHSNSSSNNNSSHHQQNLTHNNNNSLSSKFSQLENSFNNRQSPPSSPRLLGLSNDALNFVGRD